MDIVTYALARKYVKDTAIGLGAVKGAPCRIQSIVEDDDKATITFTWTATDGTDKTSILNIKNGLKIIGVDFNDANELVCTMSDGTELKTSPLKVGGVYFTTTSPVTNKIGQFGLGEEITEADKMTLNEALNRILHLNNDPTATLEVTKLSNLMEVGQSVQNPKLRLVFTNLGNGTITNIQFLKNGVEINNQPFIVGTTEYTYDDVNTIATDTTYKAVITYNFGKGDKTLIKTFTSKFVRKSFYGTTDQDTFDLTSDNIRSLSGGLLGVKKGDKININITQGSKEVIFAYPSDLGDVTDVIFVEGMNSSVKDVFTQQVISVGDYGGTISNYNVYTYKPINAYTKNYTYVVTI